MRILSEAPDRLDKCEKVIFEIILSNANGSILGEKDIKNVLTSKSLFIDSSLRHDENNTKNIFVERCHVEHKTLCKRVYKGGHRILVVCFSATCNFSRDIGHCTTHGLQKFVSIRFRNRTVRRTAVLASTGNCISYFIIFLNRSSHRSAVLRECDC